jgi:hypothetical protein
MNEQELAGKIVQHLDRGLADIKSGTLYQLQAARRAALDASIEIPQPVVGLAWAGRFASYVREKRYLNAHHFIAIASLLLALVGISYWQTTNLGNDVAEVDARLLTGDLPIDAYLDSGFEAWLNRSSR